MTAAPDVAPVRVVVVTYRPGRELEDFLASLASAGVEDVELVVVENGPDPAAARSATGHGVRVLHPGRNLGYGAAANLGAAGATQPWIVVANPDIVWHPGSLAALVAAGTAEPTAGSLGPLILDPDGTVYPSARNLPSLTTGTGHALLGRVWPANPWSRRYRRDTEPGTSQRPAGWLSGSCLLLRREAFEAVGGFDDSYFMFFEDVDLGERLGRAGWANVFVPTAVVTHVGGTSWRARPGPMIRAHHASAAQYLCRRYHRWYQAPVRWAVRVGLALRQGFELRAARRSGATRAADAERGPG